MKNILPFERSYWIIPGKLLAGEYPAAISMEETKRKLKGLADAGIKTIINLTELGEINHSGVRLYDYEEDARALGMEMYRRPIKDLSIPMHRDVDAIIALIEESIKDDKAVYFHCWGGVGRTGTVLGCYLLHAKMTTKDKVFDMINYLKRTTSISQRQSPENEKQKAFVLKTLDAVKAENFSACMLGGAIGDALGAPIEFTSQRDIIKQYGALGLESYVEHRDGIGRFTDDTQMTLFTAEAVIRDYHRQVQRGISGALVSIAHHSYLRWYITQGGTVADDYIKNGFMLEQRLLHQRRAPGNTCLEALRSGVRGSMDRPINNSKGCGTIMRVAPIGLFYNEDRKRAFKFACQLSAITHGHPTGYLAAGVFASIISDLTQGIPLMEAILNAKDILKTYTRYEETLEAIDAAIALYERVKGKGLLEAMSHTNDLGEAWVAEEALAISLYASLLFEKDFKSGIQCAINHSGDSDSTGSIVGNILGLINGLQGIPKHWLRDLEGYQLLKEVGEDLFIKIKGNSCTYDDEWHRRYPAG